MLSDTRRSAPAVRYSAVTLMPEQRIAFPVSTKKARWVLGTLPHFAELTSLCR